MSEWEWETFINLDKLEIEGCRKIDEGSKKKPNQWRKSVASGVKEGVIFTSF